MEAAIVLVSGVVLIVGKEILKVIKIKNEKKKIKNNLIKAFNDKNIRKIKKYILYIKDFDKKYQTKKEPKYLNKIVMNNPDLNEENVLSLLTDFSMIDALYEDKSLINHRLENKLDIKLDLLERKRKETIIRQNQMNQVLAMKQRKMNKGKTNKRKKSAMG